MFGVHVELVIVDVNNAMVDSTGICVVVKVVVVVEFRRKETVRSLRLPGLLDSRQTDGRALTERKVWLKHKPMTPRVWSAMLCYIHVSRSAALTYAEKLTSSSAPI